PGSARVAGYIPAIPGEPSQRGVHEIGLFPVCHSIAVAAANGRYSLFDSDLGGASFRSAKDLAGYIEWMLNTFYPDAIKRATITTYYYDPRCLFELPQRGKIRSSCFDNLARRI
ncbi:hypothetical protein, partial [Serratia marcescens]|uniref:hypothetical protein n=1 Tax=Serratia marcescens TaxID=615 RepID=UPI001652E27E